MVIYKKVEIHLDRERHRVLDNDNYDDKLKKKLLDLYDLFETGNWKLSYGHIIRYFHKSDIDEIHYEVYRVIKNYANLSEVYILDPNENK